jgi:hypothetical protein
VGYTGFRNETKKLEETEPQEKNLKQNKTMLQLQRTTTPSSRALGTCRAERNHQRLIALLLKIETAWRRTQGIPVWWNFETYKDKETAATIYYGKQLERE